MFLTWTQPRYWQLATLPLIKREVLHLSTFPSLKLTSLARETLWSPLWGIAAELLIPFSIWIYSFPEQEQVLISLLSPTKPMETSSLSLTGPSQPGWSFSYPKLVYLLTSFQDTAWGVVELPSSTHVVQVSCRYRLAVIGSPLSLQGTFSYLWSRDYSLSSSWLPELTLYSDFSPTFSPLSTSSSFTSWSWQMFLQSLYSINRTLFERPKEALFYFL